MPRSDDAGEVEGAHGPAHDDERDEARRVVEAEIGKARQLVRPGEHGERRMHGCLGGDFANVKHCGGDSYFLDNQTWRRQSTHRATGARLAPRDRKVRC